MLTEFMFLKVLIDNPQYYSQAIVSEDMFTDENVKKIYAIIRKLNYEFSKDKLLIEIVDNSQLVDTYKLINDQIAHIANFEYYQQSIINQYFLNKANDVVKNFNLTDRKKISDYELMITELNKLDAIRYHENISFDEDVQDVIQDMLFPKQNKILSTGYGSLNKMVGGYDSAGAFWIIGARPSMGKTAFALNLALLAEANNCDVCFFSLETSKQKIISRLGSTLSKVQLFKFREPQNLMDNYELDRAITALGNLKNKNIVIDDNAICYLDNIRKQASKMYDSDRHSVIIIDHLSHVRINGRYESRLKEIEAITRELVVISKRYNTHIILLSQLNRGVESRQDKRPMMSDLREAGSIEQDADVVMFLYRDDYYNIVDDKDDDNTSKVELIVSKNRDGEVGTLLFKFDKSVMRFEEVAW